jgi:uncharacterized protein (TIGR02266 family)
MADNDKRGADRVPAALRLKLRYTDVESFIDKYAANVSKGGIFIASKAPKPVGTVLRFEFQLADGSPVVRGEGKVVWVKEFDAARPTKPHGMGVKFTRLDNQSKAILDRMLALKGQTSGMGPLPVEGSGMVPLPASGSGPLPVVEGSGPRPIPAESSAPRAIPAERSGPRPVRAEGSGPRALPAESSAPRPLPTEGSGPRAIAAARPAPRIEAGPTVAVALALQPALAELEALASELGFTDEALAAAIARAREIAAGANGDLAGLLDFTPEAPPAPRPVRARPRPRPATPPSAQAAVAAAIDPLLDDDGEEHTIVDRGLGRIAAQSFGTSGEEGTSPGFRHSGEEETRPGLTDGVEDEATATRSFAGEEAEATPIDNPAPYAEHPHDPPDDHHGGPRRGHLGDVVKKIFRK